MFQDATVSQTSSLKVSIKPAPSFLNDMWQKSLHVFQDTAMQPAVARSPVE